MAIALNEWVEQSGVMSLSILKYVFSQRYPPVQTGQCPRSRRRPATTDLFPAASATVGGMQPEAHSVVCSQNKYIMSVRSLLFSKSSIWEEQSRTILLPTTRGLCSRRPQCCARSDPTHLQFLFAPLLFVFMLPHIRRRELFLELGQPSCYHTLTFVTGAGNIHRMQSQFPQGTLCNHTRQHLCYKKLPGRLLRGSRICRGNRVRLRDASKGVQGRPKRTVEVGPEDTHVPAFGHNVTRGDWEN